MATRLVGLGPASQIARRYGTPIAPAPRTGRRDTPWLRRLLALCLALLTVGAALQGVTALAVGTVVAGAVEQQLGGHVTARISALPFWQLAAGRFEHLTVAGQNLRSGDLAIAQMRAEWAHGRVDMAALEAGRPIADWLSGGRLTVTLVLGASALRRAAPHRGTLSVTAIRLEPPDVRVTGRLRFDGLDLPFRATGRPDVVDGGDVLVFLVTVVNAGPIVLRSALGQPVVDLRRTPLSGVLWITGARVHRDGVVVELANRPAGGRTGRAALS